MLGMAGFPQWYGTDYDAVFSDIAAAGIEAFMPLSLYQEQPTPEGTGSEVDFLPAPWGTGAALDAMRTHGVGLILPANIVYPVGVPLPTVDTLGLMAPMIGDIWAGFYNYDEPRLNGVQPARSVAVADRWRAVGTGPVMQIFTEADATMADYGSDALGLTVYPLDPTAGWIDPSPHVTWLHSTFPNHQHVGLLQGFGYRNLYSKAALRQFPKALIDAARPPTADEMRLNATQINGVDHQWWYGASYLDRKDGSTWDDILTVSAELAS